MTNKNLLLGAALAVCFTTAAVGSEPVLDGAHPTHVVELFTSQGCSSCPPANRFVGKLTDDPNMLVLTYGVTYWDYLGWKDTFGKPEFTQRQRDYRDAFEAANIYTPQIVLGGSAHSPRYSRKDVQTMPLEGHGVELRVSETASEICFTANLDHATVAEVVSFTPGEQAVAVKRGENGGRTLTLTNVVTNVTDWGQPSDYCVTPKSGQAYAALVHDKATARIIDAAVFHPK